MTKKYKDNVIPFPTPKEQEIKKEEANLDFLSNDCVDCSHYLMEVLEEFITTGQVSETLMDMDFRDETKQESRDMFVIVNMLNAMFNRYYGMPHALHREMDRVYTKIKLIDSQNDNARQDLQDEFDIVFSPEFEPENPDDTDWL